MKEFWKSTNIYRSCCT